MCKGVMWQCTTIIQIVIAYLDCHLSFFFPKNNAQIFKGATFSQSYKVTWLCGSQWALVVLSQYNLWLKPMWCIFFGPFALSHYQYYTTCRVSEPTKNCMSWIIQVKNQLFTQWCIFIKCLWRYGLKKKACLIHVEHIFWSKASFLDDMWHCLTCKLYSLLHGPWKLWYRNVIWTYVPFLRGKLMCNEFCFFNGNGSLMKITWTCF
jgi:hypothetical protein